MLLQVFLQQMSAQGFLVRAWQIVGAQDQRQQGGKCDKGFHGGCSIASACQHLLRCSGLNCLNSVKIDAQPEVPTHNLSWTCPSHSCAS